jgi:hypothetical protein
MILKVTKIIAGQLFVAIFAIIIFSSANQAQQPDPTKKIVYITRKGNRYHLEGCRYLSKSKIAIDIEQAKKYYQPCKVCKPDSLR